MSHQRDNDDDDRVHQCARIQMHGELKSPACKPPIHAKGFHHQNDRSEGPNKAAGQTRHIGDIRFPPERLGAVSILKFVTYTNALSSRS
jgi:hypothetical protein